MVSAPVASTLRLAREPHQTRLGPMNQGIRFQLADLALAVLISGRGSNLQALIDACADPSFPARTARVISNVAGAPGLERAALAGIPTSVVDHKAFASRAEFDAALRAAVAAAAPGLVCLAGFMRILGPEFVAAFAGRLINIHPSLLPAFDGLDVHERVLESGVRLTGCTVHFVQPETDRGPIILQAAVPVHPGDTPESLEQRVLAMEHRCYPAAVRWIAEGRMRIEGDVVTIDGAQPPIGALVNPESA